MVRDYNKKIANLKDGRKTKMLLVFLGLSFMFWMLIKLSKEYTDNVKVKVEYINLPKGKMLQGEVDERIDVSIRTYGFNLIKYHASNREVEVNINSAKRKKGTLYYMLSNELLPQVKNQMAAEIEVLAVFPDTIYFNLGISKTKEVPVVPNIDITYQPGYSLLNNLNIEPSTVIIDGPEVFIDSIEQIKTEKIVLTDINSDIEVNIEILKLDKKHKVNYSVNEVNINGKVEKFTEAKYTIPFSIKNLPENFEISTFPAEVEVVFKVGISDYNKINKNDFRIVCDFDRTQKHGLNYLIPEIVSKPDKVNEVKIVPNKIEFLIKE